MASGAGDSGARPSDIGGRLTSFSLPDDERTAWKPLFFHLSNEDERLALTELLDSGRVRSVHDFLALQLEDLAQIRNPSAKGEELDRLAQQLVGDTPPEQFGVWVYYPWSGRLVHIVPEADFIELRTDRNRNKITREEQERLGSLRLGVVGLSVGQATALTLAMEGMGGLIRLADFDFLAPSNLNRLRAGVHDLGVPKVLITAREIAEINPFARVEIFDTGITEENLDAFLTEPEPLDLVFEECDDLRIKILLRERAKAHRIAVLMETSDRGMLDIERFDLEPDRPLLHGLVDSLNASELGGLTTFEKVPIVLRVIGPNTMSKRMSGSLIDVDTSLASWPQLASGVALGGAIITDVARRIALGELTSSGRYYVDPEEIINDSVPSRHAYVPPFALEPIEAEEVGLPALEVVTGTELSEQQIRALVSCGIMAPSGGNSQPWRFVFSGGSLRCVLDVERSESMLDFNNQAAYLACGAAVENIELAAARMGVGIELEVFPEPDDPTQVCTMSFVPLEQPAASDLVEYIPMRVTNRRLAERRPLPSGAAQQLRDAADYHFARLDLTEDPAQLELLAEVIGRGERVRMLSQTLHTELMGELRWTAEDVLGTRDGVDIATLEPTLADLAGMRLMSSWPLMELVKKLGGGEGLARPTRKAIASASAVGLVSAPGVDASSFFTAGRAVQRVWLTATKLHIAFQPMSAVLYLLARLLRGSGEGFDQSEREELTAIRARLDEVFEPEAGRGEALMFRLAHADAPSARALRRRVDDVLRVEP